MDRGYRGVKTETCIDGYQLTSMLWPEDCVGQHKAAAKFTRNMRTVMQRVDQLIDREVMRLSAAIDGGAHCGLWSIALAHRFQRVEAFEPFSDMTALLRHNTQNLAHVRIHPSALGLLSGACGLKAKSSRHSYSGCVSAEGADAVMTTIDQEIDFTLRVALIKLDIEGMETSALIGARDTILRCQPVIVVETDRAPGLNDVLQSFRYHLDFSHGKDAIYVPL